MGYTRKDRMMNGMWPKSSKQFADHLETRILKLGLGLGAALLSDSGFSSRSRHGQSVSSVPFLHIPSEVPSIGMSTKTATVVCLALLALAPSFQILGYISYTYWGFWTFFSLLLFSTLSVFCIGFTFVIIDDTRELGNKVQNRFFIATLLVAVLSLCLSIWPLLVKDSERSALSFILFAIEDILLIAGSITLYRESTMKLKKGKINPSQTPVIGKPPISKRTTRIVRIKEMEARYDKVQTALSVLLAAENKLEELNDDIDVLREYYDSGQWQKDFEADEQGKLPKDLKRGILSEDGLWNLLDEVESRI